jgi:hypothetical protein
MSASKRWVSDEQNIAAVLCLYRSRELKTMKQIARQLGTTENSVQAVIGMNMPREERRALAILRYSASKIEAKNPMFGKLAEQHPNWKGPRPDQKGHMTIICERKRVFVHREIMLKALGLPKLPEGLEVHHIDGDGENNDPDNLALVTRKGHSTIHALQRRGGKAYHPACFVAAVFSR